MKKNESPIRQLIKFSNYSLCITLPKEYIDNLGWQQGDRISFKLEKNKYNLILTKERPIKIEQKTIITDKTTLAEIAQNIKSEPTLTPIEKTVPQVVENNNIIYDSLEPIPQIG